MALWQKYRLAIKNNCIHAGGGQSNLGYWRNQLFSDTMAFLIPLALIAVIPGIYMALESGLITLAAVDLLAIAAVLSAAFLPKIPVFIRKLIFCAALYAVSVTLLYYLGLFGPGLLYLLAISVFAILIFKPVFATVSVIINALICLIFGVMIYYNLGDSQVVSQYQIGSWIAVTSNLIFLNVVSVLLIPKLFKGLQFALTEQEKLTFKLQEEGKRLEMSMNQLEAKNEELEDFAYTASHDLKEPLRMVRSFLELLEKRYKHALDKKARQYIHFAVDGAERMQQLIEDLLEYSRVGRHSITLTKVQIKELVLEAKKNLKTQIEENKAEIRINDNLPEINASHTEMMQVFQNLLSNAIKFRNDGQNPVITVGGEKSKNRTTIWVKDNGIGIPGDNIPEVFDIFKRLNNRTEYPGTGIGLAICRKIIERHNGSIYVESEPGKGSTFFIKLKNIQ